MAMYTRFQVRKKNLTQVNIAPNANDRIVVYDSAGTDWEITNEPDVAPPEGQVPVLTSDGTTYIYLPYFAIEAIQPIPLPDTVAVTIVEPGGPLAVDAGDSVTLSAVGTVNGEDASGNVAWTSSLDGKIGYGAKIVTNELSVGAHTITATLEGWGATATDTESVTVANASTPPVVTILGPTAGTYGDNAAITFSATAIDAQDGNISTNIRWYTTLSTKMLYQGQIFTTADLPIGNNIVSARCTDSDGNEGSASIAITIYKEGPDLVPLGDNVVLQETYYGALSVNTTSTPVVQ